MKNKKVIYLASPYSMTEGCDDDLLTRFEAALKASGTICALGGVPLSPIVLAHHMSAQSSLPTDWEFWRDFCVELLERCDELWVLDLPGWQQSVGVHAEIVHALGPVTTMPVRVVPHKTLEAHIKICGLLS